MLTVGTKVVLLRGGEGLEEVGFLKGQTYEIKQIISNKIVQGYIIESSTQPGLKLFVEASDVQALSNS